ncbi:MAG: hypothetical protein JJ978_04710 [Roseivirga sp.]|jgi:hypothetical protein|uniref:hypothetical protein n=1 Tax=Roseivirga sp. TaxID=1964215 RepID=UPI001B049481|nr:hypothetical protein [Roseivirga sp.]MBO6494848.1 hypothetical protein [Roseivirga sp.]
MKKTYKLVLCGAIVLGSFVAWTTHATAQEYELCPGRGERCARVEKDIKVFGEKIATIPIWLKKTKGGPGLIIKQ